jgi:hypothetical protein
MIEYCEPIEGHLCACLPSYGRRPSPRNMENSGLVTPVTSCERREGYPIIEFVATHILPGY